MYSWFSLWNRKSSLTYKSFCFLLKKRKGNPFIRKLQDTQSQRNFSKRTNDKFLASTGNISVNIHGAFSNCKPHVSSAEKSLPCCLQVTQIGGSIPCCPSSRRLQNTSILTDWIHFKNLGQSGKTASPPKKNLTISTVPSLGTHWKMNFPEVRGKFIHWRISQFIEE